MNILYITHDGLTGAAGRSQILPFLCNLAQKGIQIQVLSLENEYTYKKGEKRIRDILNGLGIGWEAVVDSRMPIVVSFFRNKSRMKGVAEELCKTTSFDIIHCRNYIATTIGLYLKKRHNLKLLFDMRIFYADDLVDAGIWNIKNPCYRMMYFYFKQKEQKLFHLSDAIVTKTEACKHILMHEYQVTVPVSIIPSCVDFDLFNRDSIVEEEQNKLKQQLGIAKDDFVIAYIGSLGSCYLLDEMMDFVRELIRLKPQTKFLVITPDSKDLVMLSAKKEGVNTQHIIVDFAILNQIPLYLSLVDVSIFFIKPVFSKKASSPKKMGEMLSMGVPVITNAGAGDVETMVKKGDFGLLVNDFSVQSYQQVISMMDKLVQTSPDNCIAAAKSCFSLEKGVDEYAHLYALLAKR